MTLTLGDRVLLIQDANRETVAVGPVYAPESVGDRCVFATDANGQTAAVHCVPADMVLDRCLIVPDASGNLVAVRFPAENAGASVTPTGTPEPTPEPPLNPEVLVAVYADCHLAVPSAKYRQCANFDCDNYYAFDMNIYMNADAPDSTWSSSWDEGNPVRMARYNIVGTEEDPGYVYRAWVGHWRVYFAYYPARGQTYVQASDFETPGAPYWYNTGLDGFSCGVAGGLDVDELYWAWSGSGFVSGYGHFARLFNAEIVRWHEYE